MLAPAWPGSAAAVPLCDLDSMISERVPLEQVDDALGAMANGEVTRSVITLDR